MAIPQAPGMDRPAMIDSPATLAQLIQEHQLLEKGPLKELTSSLLPRFTDVRRLAKEILHRGWMTAYQLNQIFLGRASELHMGPYVILDRLGEGGMGQVFKARHRLLNRLVALKVIRQERLGSPEAVRRFFLEVQAAGRLDHPNIVVAYDADQIDGIHYFAMEYVKGVDLARLVKQSGPLSVAQACDAMLQVASGLQHAFELGMVHRDIKPSNLFLTQTKAKTRQLAGAGGSDSAPADEERRPVVKILDMGLVRCETLPGSDESTSGALTQVQAVLGTPDFIAPEQARDAHSADIRSDLYSLGCTFYFLLTGVPPFPGGTAMEKLLKHWLERPKPLRDLRPEVPEEFVALIDRLLAKRPEERFQTPVEVVQALEMLNLAGSAEAFPATGETEETMALGADPFPALGLETTCDASDTMDPASSFRRLEQWKQRRVRLWVNVLGGLFLAILVGVTAVMLLLPGPFSPKNRPDAARPTLQEEAKIAYLQLIDQMQKNPNDGDQARAEILAFRCQFAGTPQALQAIDLLTKLPSPLDRCEHASLPPQERFPWVAAEVAAIWGDQRWRHWGPVQAVAVNAAGTLVASGGDDRLVYLQETASGKTQVFTGHAQPVSALAFNRDHSLLASGGADGWVILWDVAGGKERARIQAHVGRVTTLALTTDGKTLITGGADRLVKLWDLTTNKPRTTLPDHKGTIGTATLSLDGAKLATCGPEDPVRLWEVPTGKLLATLPDALSKTTSLAFAPDSKSLALCLPVGGVHIWDLTTNKENPPFPVQGPVAYSADGKTLLGGNGDGALHFWDLASNKDRLVLPAASRGRILSLATEGKVLAAGDDQGDVRLWDPADGHLLAGPGEPWTSGTFLSFSADCKMLVGETANCAGKCCDLATGKETPLLLGHRNVTRAMATSPDGHTIALGGDDKLVRFWDLAAVRELPLLLQKQSGSILCLAYSPDGRLLASGSQDGSIVLWDAEQGKEKTYLRQAHVGGVTCLAFSPDGASLVSGGMDKVLLVWDLEKGKKRGSMAGHQAPVTALTYVGDGSMLLSGGEDRTLRKWDMDALQARGVFPQEHTTGIRSLVATLDGKKAITAGLDGRVLIWDIDSSRRLQSWQFPGPVNGLALALDGRHLAVAGGNGCVYLFRLWPRGK